MCVERQLATELSSKTFRSFFADFSDNYGNNEVYGLKKKKSFLNKKRNSVFKTGPKRINKKDEQRDRQNFKIISVLNFYTVSKTKPKHV